MKFVNSTPYSSPSYLRPMTTLFAAMLSLTLSTPPDSLEWATFGSGRGFYTVYERDARDTTVLHGSYVVQFQGRKVVAGSFFENRKTGLWEHYDHTTGKLTSRGYYTNGRRSGRWDFYTLDGFRKATKDYNAGKPVGEQVSYYVNGKPRLIVEHPSDTVVRSMKLFYPNGDTLLRRSFSPEGDLYRVDHVSYYERGPRYEEYSFLLRKSDSLLLDYGKKWDDYLIDIAFIDPGRRHRLARSLTLFDGPYRKYHPNGRLWEQEYYERGVIINKMSTYNQRGKAVDCGDYEDGNGKLVRLQERGDTTSVEHFRNGLLEGPARYFYERNVIRAKGQYRKGEPVGQWTLHQNDGNLSETLYFHTPDSVTTKGERRAFLVDFTGLYLDGRRHGTWVHTNAYRDTTEVISFKNGLLHGRYCLYDAGLRYVCGELVRGVKRGAWTTYNRSGKVTYQRDFDPIFTTGEFRIHPEDDFAIDFPVLTSFKSTRDVQAVEPIELLETNPPEAIKIDDHTYRVDFRVGRYDGDANFIVEVEDTGHVSAIWFQMASREDFSELALGYLQRMTCFKPLVFEGLPRHTRVPIAFYFTEIR